MRRGLSRVCFTITHGTQVVERAVDNFFRWKKVVTFGEDVLTWAALQRLDSKAEEGEDRLRAQRALRLLQGDVVHKEGENSGSHGVKLETVFEAFCREHPAWGDASQSFVFFRDHEKVTALPEAAREQLKVTRIQHSGGLCYMHAPAVMQHNLVTVHSGGEHHEMLNVAKYIVEFFSADMIFAHVVEHTGASSAAFLKNIMGPKGRDTFSISIPASVIHKKSSAALAQAVTKSTAAKAERIAKTLKTYGVGLVAKFMVVPAFQGKEVSFTANALRGEVVGLHAMTLVGHRENDGQHLFLLQNWWKEKQFIEVSAEYLAAARAGITFVGTEVTEIPKEFPTDDNVFCMETEDLAEEPVRDGGPGTYPEY